MEERLARDRKKSCRESRAISGYTELSGGSAAPSPKSNQPKPIQMQDVDYMIESADESISFRGRGKRREDPEMDITPMIDITFLLLIFFLVASRLTDEAFVELPRAENGVSISNDASLVVTLTKGSGEDANIYLGDGAYDETKLTVSGFEAQQEQLERFIEQGLSVGSKQHLLIKAEEGVKHRDVARVAKAAGGVQTSVLYVAVMEER